MKWNLDSPEKMRPSYDAVARRVDRTGAGTFSDDPADNFYYLTDVMFSVRAITDSTGLLHTRLDYTPYGVAMHGLAADVNGDGVVTVSDLGVVSTNHNSGDELKPGDTGYDPDAFLDGGDEIDVSVFLTRYSPYVSGGSNPTFNAGWIDNPEDPTGRTTRWATTGTGSTWPGRRKRPAPGCTWCGTGSMTPSWGGGCRGTRLGMQAAQTYSRHSAHHQQITQTP